MKKPGLPFELMIITEEQPGLLTRIEAALASPLASRSAVQLRMKGATARSVHAHAQALRALTRQRGALLLINDRVDIALSVGADGVQLPGHGLPPADVRSILPPHMLVGVSCHDASELASAARGGADFALLSPVYPVAGKGPALGLSGLAALCAGAPLPIVALGGLTEETLPAVRAAGATAVAAIRAVLAPADPARAVTGLLEAWARAPNMFSP